MTGGEFSEVDFDLLADYVGGALDDDAARETVARLVADDPAWRSAHAELVTALVGVDAGLGALARTAEPMPADITEQLTTALTAAPPPVTTAPAWQSTGTPGRGRSRFGRRLTAVPPPARGDVEPDAADPGSTAADLPAGRRRWRPRAGALAAAAAVVAFAGLGVAQLGSQLDGAGSADSVAGEAPASLPLGGQDAESGRHWGANAGVEPEQIIASQRRYERTTLAGSASLRTSTATPKITAFSAEEWLPLPSGGTGDLRRLNNAAALRACLAAIALAHGQPLAAVELVDFAVFEDDPAVVVFFTDAAGGRRVWVSGPACGLGESGAATRYQARVS